jgi:hypothetical protein
MAAMGLLTTPLPKADQLLPFQRATRVAGTPPACAKLPAAINIFSVDRQGIHLAVKPAAQG